MIDGFRGDHFFLSNFFESKITYEGITYQNNEAAFQAIKALREHGYAVPDDVSVVGYDNYLISEVSDPTITTISIDAEYMAELTVNTLIQRLNDPSTVYRMRTIAGELVIKNSVLPLNR